jgi:hypothetical protein
LYGATLEQPVFHPRALVIINMQIAAIIKTESLGLFKLLG